MAITIRDNRIVLNQADSTAGWTATDGPTLFTSEPSPVEATGSLGMQVSSGIENAYTSITSDNYSNGGSLFVLMADRAEFDTTVNGGIGVQVGDGTNRIAYHVGGSDGTGFRHDVGLVKWASFQVDLANKPANFTAIAGSEASLNEAAITQVGVYFETVAKSVGGAENVFWDIIRFADNGVGIEVYGGTVGTPESWDTVTIQDRANGNLQGHYLIRLVGDGAYDIQGNINIGDTVGTNNCYINASIETFLWGDRGQSTNNYYRFNGNGNGTGTTDINFDNCIFNNALDGSMDFSSANITADFRGCTIIGWGQGILNGDSGNTWSNNVFIGCGQIETTGASMSGCSYSDYTGAANTSQLYWNSTTDPNIYLAGSEFTMPATATHAIQFPAAMTNQTITITDCVFNGYSATNNQNDSTFNVLATTGILNINVIGSTGDFSYRTAGATVNLIIAPVTTIITVTDTDGVPIEDARVFFYSDSGLNYFLNRTISSLTRVGNLATVVHAASTVPLVAGNKVFIEGATDPLWNGIVQVNDVLSTTSYTYKLERGNPTLTTASGTLTDTHVWFGYDNGITAPNLETDSNGQVKDVRSIPNDETIQGRVRRATTGDLYKTTFIKLATIDKNRGLNLNVILLSDE